MNIGQMIAALVEATGHGYRELMETPYEDVLQMNVDALAVSEAREEAMDNEHAQ